MALENFRWCLTTLSVKVAQQKSYHSSVLNIKHGNINAVVLLDLKKGVLTICTTISVKKFRSNGTGILFTIYKIPINFSLSLKMKPGTVGRVGKNGKNVIPRNVVLVFRKISTGMNRSI